MALRKGGAAAKAADKANRPSFDKVDFFKIEEDEGFMVLRFIDDGDEWPFTDMHSFVPTRGPAANWEDEKKSKYPTRNGAVCRKDEMFEGKYPDCYICDHMVKDNGKAYRPTIRMWARAIVRLPIVGTDAMVEKGLIQERRVGKVVAYKDEIIEVEETGPDGKPTGKKVKKPRIVVVNMGMKNFFNRMQGYYQSLDGTVRDRDFKVTREGKETDTDYVITMLDRTEENDLNDPDTYAKYAPHLPDLERLIEDRATDDYYQYFFDKRVPHPERKTDKTDESDNAGDDAPKQTKKAAADNGSAVKEPGGVNPDRLKAMSAEVRGRYGKAKAAPAEESAAPDSQVDDEPEWKPSADELDDDERALVGASSGPDED